MTKIKDLLLQFKYEIFALCGALIILWQMLLPGYVLVLDTVFGPHAIMPPYAGLAAATFLPSYLIYLFHFVLSAWIIEQIILVLLFFLLFYLPLRFYPFKTKNHEEYFVAVLYAINPFVYERFLAGQWEVLYAYAFLFPLVSSLIQFYRSQSWQSIVYAFASLLIIGVFSLHFLVMGSMIITLYIIVSFLSLLISKEHPVLKIFLSRFLIIF